MGGFGTQARVAALTLVCALFIDAALAPSCARRLEARRVSTADTFGSATFTSVTFLTPFDVTPVVVSLATDQGGDSSALRIRNVTTTGFEIAALEPPGNDGPHVSMDIDYIAMEPGSLVLPGGETVVAGFHTTSSVQRAGVVGGPAAFDTVSFGAALSSNAAVIASIQTMNSESGAPPGGPSQPWLTVAIRNPSTTDVEMALERSEVAAGTVSAETIGYLAFPSGASGSFVDTGSTVIAWEATQSPDSIVGFDNSCVTTPFTTSSFPNARVVATKNSRDGGDGGWLRRCALTASQIGLQVDEDVANDSERAHTNEIAGILAFSDTFHAMFTGVLSAVKSVTIEEDPVNGASGALAVPGARARYAVDIESSGNSPTDNDSVVFVDALPAETSLVVADIAPGAGPVLFTDGTPSSALTYTFAGLGAVSDDISFSNDNGATFAYTPTPDANGADPNVTHIRVEPKGSFAEQTTSASPNFRLEFDVLVE
ncbi:MAG: hypothetical protein AAGJ87_00170 [Pseudomonadota bacterium]